MEVADEFGRQAVLKMIRANRESKPLLKALALVAALAMYEGLLRRPIEEVLARPVGGLTISRTTVIIAQGVAFHHTDQGPLPRVINITASNLKFIPQQIMLKKGLPVTLRLTSIDRTHGFLLQALKIDTDVSPGTTTELMVTPQVAGTFKALATITGVPGTAT